MRQYAITAAVCALVAFVTLRKAKASPAKLSCGQGSKFVPTTSTAGWSAAVADQIRKYGGYCARDGSVIDAGTKPYGSDDSTGGTPASEPYDGNPADSDGGVWDDVEDPYLITHPWQLP